MTVALAERAEVIEVPGAEQIMQIYATIEASPQVPLYRHGTSSNTSVRKLQIRLIDCPKPLTRTSRAR
ncbi:hypothetical protein CERSUDRAFT_119937 [Gelatoporia subvermispora B]|uniref:Uncharacterized protein n=1 Tax=Ceriporiopsis subvermispora (strain B) TaxID=914234 RepID=M2Q346_CERS8|nr:hypothetical protein CERSUDRAFT_119937 [Gelatoporia subvermispora B]